jgi:hypothetical protein
MAGNALRLVISISAGAPGSAFLPGVLVRRRRSAGCRFFLPRFFRLPSLFNLQLSIKDPDLSGAQIPIRSELLTSVGSFSSPFSNFHFLAGRISIQSGDGDRDAEFAVGATPVAEYQRNPVSVLSTVASRMTFRDRIVGSCFFPPRFFRRFYFSTFNCRLLTSVGSHAPVTSAPPVLEGRRFPQCW